MRRFLALDAANATAIGGRPVNREARTFTSAAKSWRWEDSLAIHVAAWRGQPAIVRLLIERGSPVDIPDANGRTPLALAVRACVDSYWTERRSPESVQALLRAGASANVVAYPSGYAEVGELLRNASAILRGR